MNSTTIQSVDIYSQNINKNFDYTSDVLEMKRSSCDVIFLQEPPWRTVRYTVSTKDREGDPVLGPPIHPAWTCIYRCPKGPTDTPRVMAFINKRIAHMRPSFRTDLVNHRD